MDNNRILCPECDAYVDFEPVTTVYPGSENLRLLAEGKLNVVTCDACSTQFRYSGSLVYRNDERRYLICYLPLVKDQRLEDAVGVMESMSASVFAELSDDERPTCRLVTEQSHFIEKIFLVEEDLDDRLIEYVKFMLYQNATELKPEKHELLYDFTADNSEVLNFIAFDRKTREPDYGMEFDLEDFTELEKHYDEDEQSRDRLNSLFAPYIVSVDRLLALVTDNLN